MDRKDDAFGRAFQSTHPVRGGTYDFSGVVVIGSISIHPPREGWDFAEKFFPVFPYISIHPPREGWDPPP